MRFNFDATGIGSLPFKEAKTACRAIFENYKSIPFWPQLPKRSFFENMYVQFSESMPGIVTDESRKAIYVDTTGVAETVEETYKNYLEGNVEFFKISEGYAQGLYQFLDEVKNVKNGIKYVKGHITGPISYALTVTDQNKKSIIYDKDLFEILTKTLVMKAKWQVRKLKKAFPSVIIFIDEPYLVSIGSSYVNINIDSAFASFDEVASAIRAEGALVGVHCCGNTDWPILLKRDIDILNFDAYNFMKEFSLYGDDIKNYLSRGSAIAWGIVPSSDAIDTLTPKSAADKLKAALKLLTEKGVKKDEISSLVTSSCGLGSLDEDRTKKIIEIVRLVSADFQK